jgi:hypothetical protein
MQQRFHGVTVYFTLHLIIVIVAQLPLILCLSERKIRRRKEHSRRSQTGAEYRGAHTQGIVFEHSQANFPSVRFLRHMKIVFLLLLKSEVEPEARSTGYFT